MVYFVSIQPTRHYIEEHEREVPWDEVVEIILLAKNPRRKGDILEIDCDGYYIVFVVKDSVLYVINAKRKL